MPRPLLISRARSVPQWQLFDLFPLLLPKLHSKTRIEAMLHRPQLPLLQQDPGRHQRGAPHYANVQSGVHTPAPVFHSGS